jgi:hypothetical protein
MITLMKASIDKLSIVGDIDETLIDNLGHNPFVKHRHFAKQPYRYQWQMIDGSVFQLKDQNETDRGRYEFNPNNWENPNNPDMHVMSILRLFKRCRLTRVDVAFDFSGIDFTKLNITDRKSRKESIYKGRDKKTETFYFGVGESNEQVRIYNKAREQGREQYGGNDTEWWRVEAQLRADKAEGLETENPFADLTLTTTSQRLDYDIKTRAMLNHLRAYPDDIKELGKQARAKYRELLLATDEHLEISLTEYWENEKSNLLEQVAMWKNLATNNVI